jgi:hypothetical protein
MRHIRYMFFISIQNFSCIDDDHKKLSLSKGTNFKIETKTLNVWISLNTNSFENLRIKASYSLL